MGVLVPNELLLGLMMVSIDVRLHMYILTVDAFMEECYFGVLPHNGLLDHIHSKCNNGNHDCCYR